jgi:ribosomal protein L11 methyltransferase
MASFLIDLGAPGLMTEDVGDEVRLTAHFTDPAPVAAVERFCSELPELFPLLRADAVRVRAERVAEEAWADNWKANFPPLTVGKRLFIHPPWVRKVPPGRVCIVIDPGMAFGTGHHATTRGCLVLLEQFLAGARCESVLDLGTGSGILAIAAVKLGAERVWALDVDKEACRAALENARANDVADRISVCESADGVAGQHGLVLANLLATQLVECTPQLVGWLRSGGVVIGSGILHDEEEEVACVWRQAGFDLRGRCEEDGWVTMAWELASES